MHVDNTRNHGWSVKKGNASNPKLATLIGGKLWEELHLLTSKETLVQVEHVKAHRTENDKKKLSHCEKFVTERNEKADELAKEGALLDEGFMA